MDRRNGDEIRRRGAEPASPVQKARLAVLGVLILILLCALAIKAVPRCISERRISCSAAERLPVPTPQAFAGEELLTLTVIDVGQGDSLLLQSPSGKTMLIDAGEQDAFSSIRKVLSAYGIERLDAVVATHAHSDHIGGMTELLKTYPVGTFYLTDSVSTTKQYTDMLSAAQKNGCTVCKTDTETVIAWDDAVEITVLNPFPGWTYPEMNNASIVLRVTFGDTSFLLTGDLETEGETLLLTAYDPEALSADVLKLGHHGSNSSTGAAFLDAVHPSIAIASVGKNNKYGHPHDEVLERLSARNITLYRTDKDGIITLFSDGTRMIAVP